MRTTAASTRFYYTVIKGWSRLRQQAQAARSTCRSRASRRRNSSTIVFHLTEPTGDFNRRMSMPATAPIPPEVGTCFEGKVGDYGRDVISNGPYMLQAGRRQVHLVRRAKAVQRLCRCEREQHHPRPQPELRPVDRSVPQELHRRVQVRDQLECGRHLREGASRAVRRRRKGLLPLRRPSGSTRQPRR